MKILIILLLGLAGLIALLLIIALFTKRSYAFEREITINKPRQDVFNYIKMLKNQNNFSKWALMDPNMKQEYKGEDGTAGFVSAWDSDHKNVGKGEQTIGKIVEGDRIDFDLHFIKPYEGRANAHMATVSISSNQTKVIWSFDSNMTYPMNLMLLFMNMDKMMGNDLETGLTNLKGLLEK